MPKEDRTTDEHQPYFWAIVRVLSASTKLCQARDYLAEGMPLLAAACLREAASEIAEANEKVLSTAIRSKKP